MAPKEKPRLNQVRVVMTEEMQTDVECLYEAILGEMRAKKIHGRIVNEFIRGYFSIRRGGNKRDDMMAMFNQWVRLQKEGSGK